MQNKYNVSVPICPRFDCICVSMQILLICCQPLYSPGRPEFSLNRETTNYCSCFLKDFLAPLIFISQYDSKVGYERGENTWCKGQQAGTRTLDSRVEDWPLFMGCMLNPLFHRGARPTNTFDAS